MIKFLIKGIVRDKSRSLLPIFVVTLGVFFVVVLDGVIGGMTNNITNATAKHKSGHIKITTKAYNQEREQQPIDLSLTEVDELIEELNRKYAAFEWCSRISLGALLDIPDTNGESRAQGPVSIQAYNFLSSNSNEANRLDLKKALVKGKMISDNGEILISSDFSERFDVNLGDTVTIFGSDMFGAMVFRNMRVAGTIRFGIKALDYGAVVMDLGDARAMLDMENAASQILGFAKNNTYDEKTARNIVNEFNQQHQDKGKYAPMMLTLSDQDGMGSTLAFMESLSILFVSLLVTALSIVLWNTGVIGGIRRYGEFGVRLAIGEEKGHIFSTLLIESLVIGVVGSLIGTALGVVISKILQTYGLNYSAIVDNSSMIIDPIIRSKITLRMFFIGFIPGVFSMLVGTALSGRAIYKRNTANLFDELI